MARTSVRTETLEQAIVEAVSTLDDADGSRTAMITAFDNARATLTDAYGDEFDTDLAIYNGEEVIDDEDEEEDE